LGKQLTDMSRFINSRNLFFLIGLVLLTMLLPGVVSAQIIKTNFIGGSGYTAIIGDWNGDGKVDIGSSNGANWYLDKNGNNAWDAGTDKQYSFGATGWTPVTGDWNGDDHTEIGVYKDGVWYLDTNANGAWNAGTDKQYSFGATGWTPVTGDWNNDGKIEIGVYKDGVWYLDTNANGAWNAGIDKLYTFGGKGWAPVAYDWNGDGKIEIGVYKDGVWYLDANANGAWNAGTDKLYRFGATGWNPVAGDWNNDRKTEVGVYRNGVFQLDHNGNGVWNGATIDKQVNFGITGYTPKAGDWNGDGKTTVGLTNGISWQLDNGDAATPSTPSTPAASSITVTAPNGGETWARGTAHTLTWSYTGNPGSTVKIEVLKGSTPVGTIAESAPIGSGGKGTYTWMIFPSGSTGNDYKVSVKSISQPTIKDLSNNFFTLTSGTTSSTTTKPSVTPTPVIKTNTIITTSGSTLYIDQYGIKGDGSDEGPAIQAALNYAASHSIKTVIFPAGKVITTGSLRIPEGLTLIGNGCTLRLKANSHTGTSPWTWIYVQEGVRVSGFKFDGNRFNGNGMNTNGLMLQGDNIFDNNEVFNCNSYAVFVYGSYPKNIRITNNYIHDVKQYGIDTGGSDGPSSWGYNVVVTGNTITNCGEVAVKIRGTKDSTISNNNIKVGARNPGGDEPSGIRLYSWDETNTNVKIANNIVTGIDQNPSACIDSDDSDNHGISITGNKVSHCYDGIEIQFNNGIITGNTISNCVNDLANYGSGNTISNTILP
jgi:hypothetical protein